MADQFPSRAVPRGSDPAARSGVRLVPSSQGYKMLDIAMLALGLIFFVATIAYVYACDRL
jgi:hypothetical protein